MTFRFPLKQATIRGRGEVLTFFMPHDMFAIQLASSEGKPFLQHTILSEFNVRYFCNVCCSL